MKPRLAIVISHPTQHFAPLYAHLAALREIELKVFFLGENGVQVYHDKEFGVDVKWDLALTEGYDHEFVNPGNIIKSFTFKQLDAHRINSLLSNFKPDLIWLHGYAARANWRVALKRPYSAQILYTSDSNLTDSRGILKRILKFFVVRLFFSRCDHFLSIGPSNKRYLEHYGVKQDNIIESAFPVDIERLIQQRNSVDATAIAQLREKMGVVGTAKIALYAGKLVPHKRPQDLLMAICNPALGRVHAVFLGSGEMQEQLRALAAQLNIANRIHFVGFVNQSGMAEYLLAADYFVFPSETEPYGAIAAEVMPFGLPMVVSDRVGAIGACVIHDRNALVYEAGNYHMIAAALVKLLESPMLCERLSNNSMANAMENDKSIMAEQILMLCALVSKHRNGADSL